MRVRETGEGAKLRMAVSWWVVSGVVDQGWFNHYKSLMPQNTSAVGKSVCLRRIAPLCAMVEVEQQLNRFLSVGFLHQMSWFLWRSKNSSHTHSFGYTVSVFAHTCSTTWFALQTQLPATTEVPGLRLFSLRCLVLIRMAFKSNSLCTICDSRCQQLDKNVPCQHLLFRYWNNWCKLTPSVFGAVTLTRIKC